MAGRSKKILVGYDGSDSARRALEAAADLMTYGSTLTVLGISNGSASETLLERARSRLLQRQVPALYLEGDGDGAEELATTADVLGADLVVVGRTNGNGTHRHGIVSMDVVRSAPCNVLIVR